MSTCTYAITPERTCTYDADAILNGDLICADHLHSLHREAVESGHADRIPGLVFLD